tara:strand:- start:1067 stop:1267 length:201 start_codon:yes stop_codon:yes gene_type:complete
MDKVELSPKQIAQCEEAVTFFLDQVTDDFEDKKAVKDFEEFIELKNKLTNLVEVDTMLKKLNHYGK